MKRLFIIALALAGSFQLSAQVSNDSISPYIFNLGDQPTEANWINPVRVSGEFIVFEKGSSFEVKIFAMSGEIVKQTTATDKLSIPQMSLPTGTYLVKVRSAIRSGKTVLIVE